MSVKGEKAITANLALLAGAAFLLFLGAGATQQFVVPQLTLERGFSPQKASWVLGTLYLVFPIGRLFSSHMLKGLGVWFGLVLGGLGYAQFPLLVANGYPFGWLVASAGVWGAAAALFWVAGGAEALRVSSERYRGLASGVFMGAVFTGQASGVVGQGWLITRLGSTWTFELSCFVTLLGCLLLALLPREMGNYSEPSLKRALAYFRNPAFTVAAGYQFVMSLGLGAVFGLLGGATGEQFGLGEVGIATGAYYVTRIALAPLAGRLSDLLGRTRMMTLAFLIGGFGLAWGAWQLTLPALILAAICLAVSGTVVPICALALAGDVAAPGERHLSLSALFAAGDFGVALAIIGGQYMRLLATNSSYAVPFGVLAGVMLLTAFAALGVELRSRLARPAEVS